MKAPKTSYKGNEAFVFVSYAHADEAHVYPEIRWLQDSGIRVWFDEGISPGAEWREELGERINACSLFLFFVSPNSIASPNCRAELNHALTRDRRVLSVHLQATQMTQGLELSLGDRQAVMRYQLSDSAYRSRLADSVAEAIEAPVAAAPPPRRQSAWQFPTLAFAIGVLVTLGLTSIPTPETAPQIRSSLLLHPPFLSYSRASLAISPTGNRIVYQSEVRGDPTTLAVRHLDTFEVDPIPGSGGARAPLFSPDGSELIFFAGTQLKRVGFRGEAPEVVADVADFGSGVWLPDDTLIIAGDGNALRRIDLVTGERSTLPGSHSEPLWSPSALPDSTHVLGTVVDPKTQQRSIVSQSLTTGTRKKHAIGRSPTYLPEGFLLYVHQNTLFARTFDAASLEAGTTAVPVITNVRVNPFNYADYAVSRTGVLVYVDSSNDESTRIELVSRTGQATALDAPITSVYAFPRFSPDAGKISYSRVGADGTQVWSLDLRRGVEEQLTSQGANRWAVWSPDGNAIAFTSTRDGLERVYTKRLGAREAQIALASGPAQAASSWAPTGLVWTRFDSTTREDVVARLTNGDLVEVATTDRYESGGALSPDGRWIAFNAYLPPERTIRIQSFPDGAQHMTLATNASTPVWSRTTPEIFYVSHDTQPASLMVVEYTADPQFTPQTPRRLFDVDFAAGSPGSLANYDAHPDGQSFVVVQAQPTTASSVRLVTSFAEYVASLVDRN